MNKLSERHFFLTQISSFNLASELNLYTPPSAAIGHHAATVIAIFPVTSRIWCASRSTTQPHKSHDQQVTHASPHTLTVRHPHRRVVATRCLLSAGIRPDQRQSSRRRVLRPFQPSVFGFDTQNVSTLLISPFTLRILCS